jgi:nucleoside-diphosphate-sugar epimerase
MPILITGGTGFIGSYVTRLLIEEGECPVLFDIMPPRGMLSELEDKFHFIQGSQSHLSFVLHALESYKIDTIFHLGGMLSLSSENNPWASFESNVVGTYTILDAARIMGIRQVVYGSTIATYSKDIPSDVIDDRTIQRPTSMYGSTKVFGELLGRFYARKFGLDFRAVRYPSIVGPGARTAHMSIYNAWAIEEPLRGNPYVLRCEPDTRCPVMYFKDAGQAFLMLSRAKRESLETMVYNLAGIDPPFTAQALVDTVKTRIPEADLSFDPDPAVVELLREIGRLRIDDSAAQREWGWKISYPLEAMVDDFISEFHTHPSWYV